MFPARLLAPEKVEAGGTPNSESAQDGVKFSRESDFHDPVNLATATQPSIGEIRSICQGL